MSDHFKSPAALSPQKRRLLELRLKEKGVATNSSAAPTLSRRPRPEFMPLAMNQEGLWFLDQLDPGKNHYSIPGTVRLRGRLEVAALEKSLNEIVRRHETLRTTFAMQADGTPYQVIAPPQSFKLPLIDLQRLPSAQREEEVVRRATAAAQQYFDLSRGPLFHAQLLRLGAEEHVLILNLHHIIADGWSMGVFTQELKALYEAFSHGHPSPLPELPIQYADFALWQRERLQGEVLETQLSYWRTQLRRNFFGSQLPADRSRPEIFSYRGAHQAIKLPPPLTEALRRLARREGMTAFTVLLAAFKILLYRYTAQSEVVVGSTFANRNASALEKLIGFFVNTLPLRTDLSGNPSFRESANRVRESILGASAHQELPLVKLVQELQPERDFSRNPFYQIVFDVLTPDHNPAVYGYGLPIGAAETLEWSGLTVTSVPIEYGIARFDLAVFLWDLPDGLSGAFEYSTDLFEAATIGRMIENFALLLNHIVADPESRLDALVERLRVDERQRQIAQARANNDTIHQRLKQIKRRPIVHS